MLAAGSVGALSGFSQVAGVPKDEVGGLALSLTVIAVNVYVVCGLAWFIRYNTNKSEQREQALADLAEANRKLETAVAENAGLHEQLLTQAREAGVLDALRPEALETARLSAAVAAVAKRWSALHGIAVQVTTTGAERPMSPAAESALLRAAQEALANVAKHARASRVGLTLSYMEHEVALDVRDDGTGFDRAVAPARAEGGFGLVALRQRIEALAGTLQVESEPGGGTAISACVPAAAGWASG